MAQRFFPRPLASKYRKEMPQFSLDFIRSGNGIGELIVQQLPVALAQSMHGGLDRVFSRAERLCQFGVGLRRTIANQAGVKRVK